MPQADFSLQIIHNVPFERANRTDRADKKRDGDINGEETIIETQSPWLDQTEHIYTPRARKIQAQV